MSLRKRIMLLAALGVLIATVPLGVMGLGMVRVATDRVLQERLAMARTTAERIDERLAEGWSQLHLLSTRAALAWTDGGLPAFRADLAGQGSQMPLFSGGLFLADRAGRILARAPDAPRLPARFTADPAFRLAVRTGRQQTSGIIRVGDGAVVIFAVPVFAGPDQVRGILGGVIDLAKPTLLSTITGLAVGASGHAAIVGEDGFVVASTDSAELFSRNEHPDFFSRFISEGRPIVGSTPEDHGPGVSSPRHVMAFAPIPSVPWGLGIGQDEQETFGPIRRLRDRIIFFELAVLLAALAFTLVDTNAVIAPLGLLRAATERIAEGDLAHQVDVRRGDEIGALARSFETMRRRLLASLEENARLQERLRSVAMVEERERIAREMHDSVGQVLGYVNTKAQAVRTLLDGGKVRDAGVQLRQLEQAAREVYADLREAILNLRATGRGEGLLPSLRTYAARFSEVSGVATDIVVEGDAQAFEFGATTEVHLIRIIQEALTNVRKHAAAHHATVRFTTGAAGPVVTVEDDGVGIAASRPQGQSGGFGLLTMQERAAAVGGTLTVRPRPGRGTVVEIALPAGREPDDARLAG